MCKRCWLIGLLAQVFYISLYLLLCRDKTAITEAGNRRSQPVAALQYRRPTEGVWVSWPFFSAHELDDNKGKETGGEEKQTVCFTV